jgi:chromate transporter
MNNRPSLPDLFLSFFRLGLTAFGGPAMVAYIKELSVNRKKWLDEETFRNGVALCQALPGATAMQTAAFVGLRSRGIRGALCAFVGFGLPAFLFMLALSELYSSHHIVPWVTAIFSGLQVAVVSIVANATYSFGRATLNDYRAYFIAFGAAALFGAGTSPFLVIILATLVSIVIYRNPDRNPDKNPDAKYAGENNGATIKRICMLLIAPASLLLALYFIDQPLFDLAALMMKIDLFAFGGGFASLPLMLHETVDVRGWMEHKTFMDGIALGQVTPGPIIITATFVGYLTLGTTGAFVSTISILMPSVLIVIATAPMFDRLKSSSYFPGIAKGIPASFVGLLLFVTIKFILAVHWDLLSLLLAVAVFLALIRKVDILYIVPVVVALSMLIF